MCLEILPSAPANLRGSLLQGAISLQWRVPEKQPERVQFYDVHYEAEEVGVANHTVTLVSTRRYVTLRHATSRYVTRFDTFLCVQS